MKLSSMITWTLGLGLGLCVTTSVRAESSPGVSKSARKAYAVTRSGNKARPSTGHLSPVTRPRANAPRSNRPRAVQRPRASASRANANSQRRMNRRQAPSGFGTRRVRAVHAPRTTGVSPQRPSYPKSTRPKARPGNFARSNRVNTRLNRPSARVPGHASPRVNRSNRANARVPGHAAPRVNRATSPRRARRRGSRRTKVVGVKRR